MKSLVWVTDLHMDAASPAAADRLYRTIRTQNPDALLVGGDIAEAATLAAALQDLWRYTGKPIYFVLGNHDFYGSSITEVRHQASRVATESDAICWLAEAGVVGLSEDTCLIGHGCWGDCRWGNTEDSPVMIQDFTRISDLAVLDPPARRTRLRQLGDEAANYLQRCLQQALQAYRHVILLTHVPPFPQACLYDGKPGSDDWLPYFTCRAVGEMLERTMAHYAHRSLRIFSGHSHHFARLQYTANIYIESGAVEYGKPEVQRLVQVD